MNNRIQDRYLRATNPANSEVHEWLNTDDPFDGLTNAVRNGQSRLALDHVLLILQMLYGYLFNEEDEMSDDLDPNEEIRQLRLDVDELKSVVASLAPSRKVTKKPTEPIAAPPPDPSSE